jgi:hypothetical protein
MSVQDIISLVGHFIASIGLVITLVLFAVQQGRVVKVQRQQTYQRLELASNELFRFTADNAGVLVHYQAPEQNPSIDFEKSIVENTVADNHIYQTLNLFEMAARLRHAKFFEDEIFGSWVIWYYEMLTSWYFRHKWLEIRPNYTKELRQIFDQPVDSFDPQAGDAERQKQFFAHVNKVLGLRMS